VLLNDWRLFAIGSAIFASLTAITAKVGVSNLPSNLATLFRTVVIVLFLVGIVAWRNEWQFSAVDKRSALFLIVSGLCTGASWLCYFHALKLGPASQVAPVDKLSVGLTMILAFAMLGEKFTLKVVLGGILVTTGSFLIAL
jgi:transporter family protein